MRTYLGISFKVWSRRRTWFWLVVNQHHNGGVIGTAASEAEAIRDARSSIEEMPTDLPLGDASLSSARQGLSNPPLGQWRDRHWLDWCVEAAQRITDKMLVRRTNLMPWSS